MTSDYRHSTDEQKTVVVAGCPNGCQAYELESSGEAGAVDDLVETVESAFGECSDCGEGMSLVRKDEPVEVID